MGQVLVVFRQNNPPVLDVVHRDQGFHPHAHTAQNVSSILGGLFNGDADPGDFGPRLGGDFQEAQDSLPAGQNVVH